MPTLPNKKLAPKIANAKTISKVKPVARKTPFSTEQKTMMQQMANPRRGARPMTTPTSVTTNAKGSRKVIYP